MSTCILCRVRKEGRALVVLLSSSGQLRDGTFDRPPEERPTDPGDQMPHVTMHILVIIIVALNLCPLLDLHSLTTLG